MEWGGLPPRGLGELSRGYGNLCRCSGWGLPARLPTPPLTLPHIRKQGCGPQSPHMSFLVNKSWLLGLGELTALPAPTGTLCHN